MAETYNCSTCNTMHAAGIVCPEPIITKINPIVVEVKHKEVYGCDLMYVCDPDLAESISQLTKKKTVSYTDLFHLKQLGVVIVDLDVKLGLREDY